MSVGVLLGRAWGRCISITQYSIVLHARMLVVVYLQHMELLAEQPVIKQLKVVKTVLLEKHAQQLAGICGQPASWLVCISVAAAFIDYGG